MTVSMLKENKRTSLPWPKSRGEGAIRISFDLKQRNGLVDEQEVEISFKGWLV